MIENCHWGDTIPNATWCPWTYYRSSGDINSSWGSIINNLNTVFPLAAKNLSTPQCWAYPCVGAAAAMCKQLGSATPPAPPFPPPARRRQ